MRKIVAQPDFVIGAAFVAIGAFAMPDIIAAGIGGFMLAGGVLIGFAIRDAVKD